MDAGATDAYIAPHTEFFPFLCNQRAISAEKSNNLLKYLTLQGIMITMTRFLPHLTVQVHI